MPPPRRTTPPAYAWDWFARQRPVWTEVARRLAAPPAPALGPHPDVPDWSDLVTRSEPEPPHRSPRGWRTLDTRTEFVAVLRAAYDTDPEVREVTDAVVTELAFLGRLGTPLAERGVLAPPRGMRWWWDHLGGVAGTAPTSPRDRGEGPRRPAVPSGRRSESETPAQLPVQLRLVDVLAGYGDGFTPPPGPTTGTDA